MNILQTSGMSYIGSQVVVVLLKAGHRVVLFDNLCNSEASVLPRIRKIIGKAPIFIEADIRATDTLAHTLRKQSWQAKRGLLEMCANAWKFRSCIGLSGSDCICAD